MTVAPFSFLTQFCWLMVMANKVTKDKSSTKALWAGIYNQGKWVFVGHSNTGEICYLQDA